MTIKVAFNGLGKMGCAAARAIIDSGGFDVVAGFDVSGAGADIGVLAGTKAVGVMVGEPSGLGEALKKAKPDVVVDFSAPDASVSASKAAADAGASMVIGTTGLSEAQLSKLKENLRGVGAVVSPNMSVGVNVFWKLVGEAAKELKGYDVEVVEAHHRSKKDAPSGTALKAVKAVCDAVGADPGKVVVYGRQGACPRREGEIGVHSIRAGDIVGEHTVMFTTLGERFEVRHVAHSRDSFASGVPAAVRFVKGRRGFFDMGDVLGLK
jgi:4-hydroxy-tetrahydrodipicolinate reductase